MVIDQAEPQFGLQTTENDLQIGQLDVGLPEGGRIPAQFVGTQAVHPGVGQLRAVNRLFCPGYPGDSGAFCRGEFDAVMAADAVGFLLQTSDPLQQFIPILFAARLEKDVEKGVEVNP